MFSWIIGSSLKFRFLVLAVAATLLVVGTQQLRKMPVDVFPEFAPPKVEIQTKGPGMTANEVEELINALDVSMLGYTSVADVSLETTPNKIRRENNSPRLDVHNNVKGRDPGEALYASAWIPYSRE
jgi:Cu/Ag efflux pump CusA